jgi:threonine dehydrogenase-like Zn-dependent dehydrogenase
VHRCVGVEAHATATLDSMYDRAKEAVMLETDRPHVLREMINVCRPAGVLSVPGAYGGLLDKVPFGMVMTDDLLRRIEEGQIDPSFVITYRVKLEDGSGMYDTFRDKQDGCVKVVLRP